MPARSLEQSPLPKVHRAPNENLEYARDVIILGPEEMYKRYGPGCGVAPKYAPNAQTLSQTEHMLPQLGSQQQQQQRPLPLLPQLSQHPHRTQAQDSAQKQPEVQRQQQLRTQPESLKHANVQRSTSAPVQIVQAAGGVSRAGQQAADTDATASTHHGVHDTASMHGYTSCTEVGVQPPEQASMLRHQSVLQQSSAPGPADLATMNHSLRFRPLVIKSAPMTAHNSSKPDHPGVARSLNNTEYGSGYQKEVQKPPMLRTFSSDNQQQQQSHSQQSQQLSHHQSECGRMPPKHLSLSAQCTAALQRMRPSSPKRRAALLEELFLEHRRNDTETTQQCKWEQNSHHSAQLRRPTTAEKPAPLLESQKPLQEFDAVAQHQSPSATQSQIVKPQAHPSKKARTSAIAPKSLSSFWTACAPTTIEASGDDGGCTKNTKAAFSPVTLGQPPDDTSCRASPVLVTAGPQGSQSMGSPFSSSPDDGSGASRAGPALSQASCPALLSASTKRHLQPLAWDLLNSSPQLPQQFGLQQPASPAVEGSFSPRLPNSQQILQATSDFGRHRLSIASSHGSGNVSHDETSPAVTPLGNAGKAIAADGVQANNRAMPINRVYSTVDQSTGSTGYGKAPSEASDMLAAHRSQASDQGADAPSPVTPHAAPRPGVTPSSRNAIPESSSPVPPLSVHSSGHDLGLAADERDICSYLPADLAIKYKKAPDWKLYEWQAECLLRDDIAPMPRPPGWQPQRPSVLQGGNLVYCAPTSAGKTLVAEVLLLRRLLSTNKAAVFVLPFVALCKEKVDRLTMLLEPFKRTVVKSFGPNSGHVDITAATGVIVCTIEKANILVNRLVATDALNLICCLVVDELHMVGDNHRGQPLELLLTKLRFACVTAVQAREAARKAADADAEKEADTALLPHSHKQITSSFDGDLQVVGMSATIPNVAQVAAWLDAHLYITTWRPVPLNIRLLVGNQLMDSDGDVERCLDPAVTESLAGRDPESIAALCAETLDAGNSVLVFCGSKKRCEEVAEFVSIRVHIKERRMPTGTRTVSRSEAIEALARVHKGNATLAKVLAKGVAFHNAGLLSEEKAVVEDAFRGGAVSVLTATSSLAAGVNLPARRVIFRDHFVGFNTQSNWLDATRFQQMAGRAGRAGLDDVGEAVLLATGVERTDTYLRELMSAQALPVGSALSNERGGMPRAILEATANGSITDAFGVMAYLNCTLLKALHVATGEQQAKVMEVAKAALHWLQQQRLLTCSGSGRSTEWVATDLGAATSDSGMLPDDALALHSDLLASGGCFNTFCDLHAMFLCTSVHEGSALGNWDIIRNVVNNAMRQRDKAAVAKVVGVDWHHVDSKARGIMRVAQPHKDRVAQRFFAAHVLLDVIGEETTEQVSSRYGLKEQDVAELQERAGHFAQMVVTFCTRMGYEALSAALSVFVMRVFRGVRSDIVSLMDVDGIGKHAARLLYAANVKTIDDVVAADEDTVHQILLKGKTKYSRGNERMIAARIMKGARQLLAERVADDDATHAAVSAHRRSLLAKGKGAKAQAKAFSSKTRPMTQRRTPRPDPDAVPTPPASRNICELPSKGAIVIWPPQLQAFLNAWALQHTWCLALCTAPPAPADGLPDSLQLPQLLPRQQQPAGGLPATPSALRGLAITWDSGVVYYLPLSVVLQAGQNPIDTMEDDPRGAPAAQLTSICCNVASEKVVWDAKTVLQTIRADRSLREVLRLGEGLVDARIAGWMLNPDSCKYGDSTRVSFLKPPPRDRHRTPHNTATALQEHASVTAAEAAASAVVAGLFGGGNLESSELLAAAEASKAALQGRALWAILRPKLEREQLLRPLLQIEMPVARVLAEIEVAGIAACPATLAAQKLPLQRGLKAIEAQVASVASSQGPSPRYNLASPADCAQLMFVHLGLPPPPSAAPSRPGGNLSTKAEVLEDMAAAEDPGRPATSVPRLISDHRSLSKIVDGFIEDLASQIGAAPADSTPPKASHGIISKTYPITPVPRAVAYGEVGTLRLLRTRFNQCMTSSGRLAMDELNLQCMPRPRAFSVPSTQLTPPPGATPSGTAPLREHLSNLRSVFRAPPGRVMLSADYRQMELRVLAFLAREGALWAVLCDPGRDPFCEMAALWLQLHVDQVTPGQRQDTKTMVYGLLYGMGTFKLARELGVSPPEAEKRIASFRASLPAITAWTDALVGRAAEEECIATHGGRKRYFSNLKSASSEKRSKDERAAVNTASQGSAADIAKSAMAALHVALSKELPQGSARIVHMMHDEFVLEVREDVLPAAARLTRSIMMSSLPLQLPPGEGPPGPGQASLPRTMPLPVQLRVGPSWGHLVPYEPPRPSP